MSLQSDEKPGSLTRRRKKAVKQKKANETTSLLAKQLPDSGSFETDKPAKVTAAKLCKDKIYVTIEWETRENGYQPPPSQMSNKVAREECPKLLVDFYESRINSKSNAAGTKTAPKPVPNSVKKLASASKADGTQKPKLT